MRAITDAKGVFLCSLAGSLALSFSSVYCREGRRGDKKKGFPLVVHDTCERSAQDLYRLYNELPLG